MASLFLVDMRDMVEEYEDISKENNTLEDGDDVGQPDSSEEVVAIASYQVYKQYRDDDNYKGPVVCMKCGKDGVNSCDKINDGQVPFKGFTPKNHCPLFPLEKRWTQPEKCHTCMSEDVNNCGILNDDTINNIEKQRILKSNKWRCGMIPVHEYYPIVNYTNKKRILGLRKKNRAFYWMYKGNILFVNSWGNTMLGFFNNVLLNLNADKGVEIDVGVGVGRPSRSTIKQRALNNLIQSENIIMNDDDGTIDSGINIKGAKKRGRPKKNKNETIGVAVPTSPPVKRGRGRPKGSKNKK